MSVLSSSDEEEYAKNINVVHQVNRDDGEMPENALSSNDEDELVKIRKNFFLQFLE